MKSQYPKIVGVEANIQPDRLESNDFYTKKYNCDCNFIDFHNFVENKIVNSILLELLQYIPETEPAFTIILQYNIDPFQYDEKVIAKGYLSQYCELKMEEEN